MPEKLYEYLLGVAVLVIAYFLRQIHTDFKSYILDVKSIKEDQNDLLNKVLLNEQKSKSDYELLNQLTSERLGTMNGHMSDMSKTMQKLSETLIRLDKNQQVVSKTMENFMKLEDRILLLEQHDKNN